MSVRVPFTSQILDWNTVISDSEKSPKCDTKQSVRTSANNHFEWNMKEEFKKPERHLRLTTFHFYNPYIEHNEDKAGHMLAWTDKSSKSIVYLKSCIPRVT